MAKESITKGDYKRLNKSYLHYKALYPAAHAPLQLQLAALLSKSSTDIVAFTSWKLSWRLRWSRVYKYKQRRQLNARKGMDLLENLDVGACTALSLAWISEHSAHPGNSARDRIESFNSDVAFVRHNETAGIYNAVGTYQERFNRFRPTPVDATTHLTENNMVEFNAAIARLTLQRGYYILTMDITNHPSSHVCALYTGPTEMRCFDPNFGEFKIDNSDRGSFLLNLKNQYGSYVDKRGGSAKALAFANGWMFSFMHA